MKKIVIFNGTLGSVEQETNEFIELKSIDVLDIKFNVTSDRNGYFNYSTMIIYQEKSVL